MSEIVFSIPCPATMLPDRAVLINIFNMLTDLPSKLQVIAERILREAADQAAAEVLAKVQPILAAAEQIRSILKNIEKILGNFPISISKPVFPSLSIPAIEWERRITALTQEFQTYVYAKILELLNAVLPLSFEIPIPGLGILVDIVKLMSSPEYRAKLKAQIAAQVDRLWPLIPDIYKIYEQGLSSLEMRVHAIFAYIMSMVKGGATKLIFDTIMALIDKFKPIWNLLSLPIPTLLTLDAKALINAAIGSLLAKLKNAKNMAAEEVIKIYKQIITALRSIVIPTPLGVYTVGMIIGEIEDFVKSPITEINRLIEAIRDFCEDMIGTVLKMAIQKIMAFLSKIGLDAVLQYLTFNFCDFLKVVGMPTSISVSIPEVQLPRVA